MSWAEILSQLVESVAVLVILYFLGLNSLSLARFVAALGQVFRVVRRSFPSDDRQIVRSELAWPVTVIVPARDTERTTAETVRSLMRIDYGEFEIVVVCDGSADGTLERLIREFELSQTDRVYRRVIGTRTIRGIYSSLVHPRLTVVDKVPGGRSDALNAGVNVSRYPLVCSVDAGCAIEDDALIRLVRPFMERPEETVVVRGAVGIAGRRREREGRTVRAVLPERPLAVFQVVDALREALTGGGGWSALQTGSGMAAGAVLYSKEDVIAAGGFEPEPGAEELDLMVRLRRRPRGNGRTSRVVRIPEPVSWTEASHSIRSLARRRMRRHRGLLRVLWRNRQPMLDPGRGAKGLLEVPFLVLFEVLGPFIEILGYAVVALALGMGVVEPRFGLLFVAVAIVYGALLSVSVVLLEEVTFRRYPRWLDLAQLVVFGVLESLGYRQLLSVFKIRAVLQVARGSGRRGRVAAIPQMEVL